MSVAARRSKLLIALAACVASLSLGLLGPGAAQAVIAENFCTNAVLGPYGGRTITAQRPIFTGGAGQEVLKTVSSSLWTTGIIRNNTTGGL